MSSEKEPSAKNLTVVTALYDLAGREHRNRRSIEDYFSFGRYLLSRPFDLVVYTDPSLVDRVMEIRRRHDTDLKRTRVAGLPLEDLPAYRDFERIRAARERNPVVNANPEKDTSLYIVLSWAKLDVIRRAIESDPFAATHFAWIDFGIAHVANTALPIADRAFDTRHVPDRVRMQRMSWWSAQSVRSPNYFQYIRGLVSCGYFSGAGDRLLRLYELFAQECQAALADGWAPSEEQIFPRIISANPELFDLYSGDYPSILVNYVEPRLCTPHILSCLRGAESGEDSATAETIRRELRTSWERGHLSLSGPDLALVRRA